MSIFGEHKCPGCGLAMSFIVDNGMILRIPSQEEEDKRRKEFLSWDFDVPVRGVPEKESPPGTTAKLEKETEKILKGWPSEQKSRLVGLLKDLWVWFNTHTNGPSGESTKPPAVRSDSAPTKRQLEYREVLETTREQLVTLPDWVRPEKK